MPNKYTPPPWAAVPSDEFYLEVLKDGGVVDKILLTGKDHFVIGRQPDICDISLDHPSISRAHAVLQFRDDGSIMLFDMQSAHGTVVNKKPCVAGAYQRLFVGDFIKFGASSRSYIVGGPETQRPPEYDSENMRAFRRHLEDMSAKVAAKNKEEQSEGISWGFGEDAVNYDDDEADEEELPDYVKNDPHYDRKYGDKFASTVKDSEVGAKDRELLEKLRKKERKVQNMQEEIKRIYMKEGKQDEGLTDGQVAAVERNDKRIEVLKEEILAIESTLKGKHMQREGITAGEAAAANRKSRREKESVMEDDALDTTDSTADASTNWRLRRKQRLSGRPISSGRDDTVKDALTYEQLCKQCEEKQREVEVLVADLQKTENILLNQRGDGGDELAAYMAQSERAQAEEARVRLITDISAAERALQRLKNLASVAAPALSSLCTSRQKVQHQTAKVSSLETTLPSTFAAAETSTVQSIPTEDGAKVLSIPGTDVIHREDEPTKVASQVTAPAPSSSIQHSKKKANLNRNCVSSVCANIVWDRNGSDGEDVIDVDTSGVAAKRSRGDRGNKKKKQRIDEEPRKKTIGPSMPSAGSSQGAHLKLYDDNEDSTWVPPSNQTGDGKTALNAKYGY